ncbi:unnamed protein product [Aphanomyces euteiches]|uniref:Mitochondrial glyco protein n=2 Tax=Aphanomyces euteiches TaxID=100861 RepID=A0A6G0XYC1_9STRA|nr:hypothetical protein Ae201684_000010 [Aphanomyces euteiches]KAH9051761.1 hypothetical protein Ae201684P_015599 [Aphanomyces euteiches]KAH9113344.1 hypothetical protein AeMF1_012430 [Aphanomyces euteiches]KAH9134496.1 hypothetical protein LEN26_006780 [Aphanomyces euteiches]KAH9144823.1 hypothetical protein AeRB84_011237 [Aphanomyces euteiches]
MLSRLSSAAFKASPALSANIGRRFSSGLSSLLGRELTEEKANCFVSEELEALREKVLANFKIQDTPGKMDVILTGKYKQEVIDVRFNIQDVADVADQEYDEEDEDEEGEYDDDVLPCIRFTARISKQNEALVFDCVASSVLTVEGVLHTENMDELNESDYEGPRFGDLEEDVQEAFADYLNERHINDDLANFITQFADLKEQKEYVTFLEGAQKFTEE